MSARLPPLQHDPEALRRRAEELLQAPPYAEQGPGPIQRTLTRLLDGLAALLEGLLADATVAGILPWVLVTLGLIVLTIVVVRLTRGLAVDRSVAQVPVTTTGRPAAAWDADADAAAERGEFRDAVRLGYAGVVHRLHERGLIEDEPGRTVRELDAALVSRSLGCAAPVAAAGERFEQIIYGGRAADRDDVEVVRAARRAVSATPPGTRASDRTPAGVTP